MNVLGISFLLLGGILVGLCFIFLLYVLFDIINDHFYLRSRVRHLIRKYTDRTLAVLPTKDPAVSVRLTKYEVKFYKNRRYAYSVSYSDIFWHRYSFDDGPWDVIQDVYKYRKNKLLKRLFW